MRGALLFLVLVFVIALVGCSNDSGSPVTPTALIVSPADGATGVRLDSVVKLTFAGKLDRDVIERGFHVISENALMDMPCPDSTMQHQPMMDCMDDSLMAHMDRNHSTHGQFSWDESGTVCTFRPDTMLSPSTRYMMHMDGKMMDMVGMHAGGDGMMQDHGSGMMGGDMVLHFTTMAASGGHDGHH